MANNDKKNQKNTTDNSNILTETIKKLIASGSPTEVSKEIIGNVVGQALKAKEDITLRVSNEMITLIQKIDFVKEFSKFAETHKFKISAEVEILKKDSKEGPSEKS